MFVRLAGGSPRLWPARWRDDEVARVAARLEMQRPVRLAREARAEVCLRHLAARDDADLLRHPDGAAASRAVEPEPARRQRVHPHLRDEQIRADGAALLIRLP